MKIKYYKDLLFSYFSFIYLFYSSIYLINNSYQNEFAVITRIVPTSKYLSTIDCCKATSVIILKDIDFRSRIKNPSIYSTFPLSNMCSCFSIVSRSIKKLVTTYYMHHNTIYNEYLSAALLSSIIIGKNNYHQISDVKHKCIQ